MSRYAQTDPIAQNLANTHLLANQFIEGSTKTSPGHIAELWRLREACNGLGATITDSQFSGIIMLFILTPSWDPVVGTLGRILDPKVITSHLNTEWSRRQGLTKEKNMNLVFQSRTKLKCQNCSQTSHTIAKCCAIGGGRECQYPEWPKGKRDSHTSDMGKPIVWSFRYAN